MWLQPIADKYDKTALKRVNNKKKKKTITFPPGILMLTISEIKAYAEKKKLKSSINEMLKLF